MNNAPQQTCYVCEQKVSPLVLLQNRDKSAYILRCPACLLTFAHPQPEEATIIAYYNGMYSDLALEFNEQKMQWAQRSARGYLATLKKHGHLEKKTLLDLGGGLGYYTRAFKEEGFETTLVEPDPVSAQFARDVLGLDNVVETGIETYGEKCAKTYDIVFLRHVIEHYADPAGLIGSIDKLLSENGILIIETDNNAGIELLFRPQSAKFYLDLYKASYDKVSLVSLAKSRPFAVDPPRHLFGYRLSNLSLLLAKKSLVPFESRNYRLGHPIYWPNAPRPTIRSLGNDLLRLRFKSLVLNLADLMSYPMRLVLERFGLASGICIYAEKKVSS